VADVVLFKQDTDAFKNLLSRVQSEKVRSLSPLMLKVDLMILLRILKETPSSKDHKLAKIITKDFKATEIAKLLNQSHEKQVANEETLNLQDEVISIVLLILVENYIRNKIESKKEAHLDNISF
jgi:hypothetical protein